MTQIKLCIAWERLLAIFFFLLVISPVFGQQNGRLRGVVVDNNGRALEGVLITIRDPDTARVIVTVSNGKGMFLLNSLKLNKYTIFFSLPGFENKEERGIEVSADYDNSILVRMYEKLKKNRKYDTQF